MNRMVHGTVRLPGSKSESNRALMIAAYGGFPSKVVNLSEAHDTVLLKALLEMIRSAAATDEIMVDCEDAGTAARFLMTYLSGKPGVWMMTGTERLCERPMAPLIDALRQLGAEVHCLKKEGFLPVRIHGKELIGGKVQLDVTQSSQFVSSLLLAAPMWVKGLYVDLVGQQNSFPYVQMTIAMMRHFGAEVACDGQRIFVGPKPYDARAFDVSSDWSAASYWYEMMALGDGGELFLYGLKPDSLQGDAVVAKWFEHFGVLTSFEEQGVRLTKTSVNPHDLVFDFADTPDLFPAVFVTCVALGYHARFQGIRNLSMKESNRVDSLISELSKVYTFINIFRDDELVIEKSSLSEFYNNTKKVIFNTHHDHRVAMALTPVALLSNDAEFDDPSVVNKSYPTFWEDIKNNCFFF